MYIYYVVMLVILLAGVKFAGVKGWNEDYMSLKNAKAVQGICAVMIILHHLSQTEGLMENQALYYVSSIGVLVVGIFFFCSGFGLVKSARTKQDYFKGFLKKRLITVLVPFYLINVLYLIYEAYIGGMFAEMSSGQIAHDLILNLIGIWLPNSHAWYIVTIAMLYIMFYLLFRKTNHEVLSYVGMGIFVVAYIVIGISMNHGPWWLQGEWWYNTIALFYIGMLFARFETQITGFFKKAYYILLPVSLVAFWFVYQKNVFFLDNVSYYCEFDPEMTQAQVIAARFLCLSWQLPATILFVLAVVLIMMKCSFGNPVIDLFGKLSLEIYLGHNMLLMFLRSDVLYVKNDVLYVGLTVVLAVAFAAALHVMDQAVEKKLSGKKPQMI